LKKQSFQDLSAASARELMIAFSNNQDIQQFVKTYINKLNDQDLFKVENVELLTYYFNNSKDKAFKFFYSNANKLMR